MTNSALVSDYYGSEPLQQDRASSDASMCHTGHSTGSLASERPAILIANLGTPEAPTCDAIRPFLREFLSDRRVIEWPALLWRPLLEGIILRTRPQRSARAYAKIWHHESSSSPLMHWTRRQAEELRKRLGDCADVRVVMRYGEPSISRTLDDLHREGCRRILLLPAYPQYAASSSGTVVDEVARWLLRARDQLEMRTVRSFPSSPAYIDALVGAIEDSWAENPNGRPDFDGDDRLVLSFHSIPQAMHEAGDPYRSECELTAALVRQRLGLGEDQVMTRYQSVFGPAQWIGPATIDTMEQLGQEGIRRVDVICPGFVADCLETLEEIAIQNRERFISTGGQEFHYIPWANDSTRCVNMLEEQVRIGLAGWLPRANNAR